MIELTSKAPSKIFLTKGVGVHKERLAAFEEALRDAGIAPFNLVKVSSILPPGCDIIPKEDGLKLMSPGQIVFCVLSRNETDENHRLIASSIGLSKPADPLVYGYLSEHESFGEPENVAGDYAEDLAASMLATIQGLEFNPESSWDEKREIWRISGKIVETKNITQTAVGKAHFWTVTVAAAVLLHE
ncbi:MAG: arginine decarboxylase, pyruvoyl-dependent [Candidatus Brocadiia bacterium]